MEAKNNGQGNNPFTIFPEKLDALNYSVLKWKYRDFKDKTDLWEDLKAGYDYFEKYKNLPKVTFLGNGTHVISE